MKLQKIFSLLLTALCLLSLLGGCGKGQAPGSVNPDRVIISISTEPETLDPTRGWEIGRAHV